MRTAPHADSSTPVYDSGPGCRLRPRPPMYDRPCLHISGDTATGSYSGGAAPAGGQSLPRAEARRDFPCHPVEGGSANDYDYAMGDPVNNFDLTGTYCVTGKNKNGTCRSLSRGAGRVARATGRAAVWTYRHEEVSLGGCVGFCLRMGFQGGTVYYQYGVGCCYAGGNAGLARKQYRDRACGSYTGTGKAGVGVYGTSGTYDGNRPSGDVAGGASVGAGLGRRASPEH